MRTTSPRFPAPAPRPRGSALGAALLLGTISLFSLGGSCGGTQEDGGPRVASGDRIERLESVDLSDLIPAERRVWVDLVNDLLSPCGEPVSVARCAADSRGCRQCVPAARYIARLLEVGHERTRVEELYEARYGRNTAVEVRTEGFPVRGAPMAPVTIVEFSDYECPHCGMAHPIVSEILREHEGQVRLVFRMFPLSGHPRAIPAARAAIAAERQGKFWEMTDMLFEHQTQLQDEDLERYARELGLDLERFRADMQSPETTQRIERDREEAIELGVEGTPAFFINGRRFREGPSMLPAYIEEELDQ